MTQIPVTPSLEKVKQRAAKIQKICQRADAEILILDELIAQLEATVQEIKKDWSLL